MIRATSFAAKLAALACCSLLAASCTRNDYAANAPQSDPGRNASITRDEAVAATYALARSRNADKLLSAAGSSSVSDPTTALSLFVVDPAKYRDRFVADYPDSPDAVNGDYGSRLLQSHLLPQGANFPIDAIGRIASHGNLTAAAKLFAAQSQASGIIADAYDIEAARVMNALPPRDALAVLAALRPPLRLAAIGETNWCALKPRRILAFEPVSAVPSVAGPTGHPAPDASVKASLDALQWRFAKEQIGHSVALCEQTRRVARQKRRASRSNHLHRGDSRKKNP